MIHQFKLNGYNIVLDTASASVHSVDDVAYDVILLYGKKSVDEIADELTQKYDGLTKQDVFDCLDDVEELKREGKLFSEDKFKPSVDAIAKRNTVVKALCLHVAHTCNLNCEYCFASQGKYHGERALMPFEVGKRAIDFLVENSGTRHHLEVDFFGGEPLMNFDVVKQIVAYARSIEKEHGKLFRFTLTTNGMLIDDDVIDFANREMDNVVLSLDGRKEINDHFRKTIGGVGSFDIIVPKFQKLVEARKGEKYYMRGTFTHRNPDFTNDIQTMLDLGFNELSMEPVVCPPTDKYALDENDKQIIFGEYEKLADMMIKRRKEGRPFTFYHYMLDLEGGPCIYKRISGCGSGTEYMAVTPTGELYPCHQFVGNKDYIMGDIWQGVVRTDIRDKFKKCNAYSRKECEECWARLYCSGGCAANAFNATGDINGVYPYGCDLFKKRIECALMLKVDEQGAKFEE
ncbi:MAG: thioether cross-link-forming SCIFF peptide maturase [Clostridia bacterium]|nr:thioether cross-link-forming SCIFF peptide maturase [Clostridia bacterium]